MSRGVNFDQILLSIDRHFMAGLATLNASELMQHEVMGYCKACSQDQLRAACAPEGSVLVGHG